MDQNSRANSIKHGLSRALFAISEPSPLIELQPLRRRARMLALMLALIIFLAFVSSIVSFLGLFPVSPELKIKIIWIDVFAILGLSIPYALSRTRHFELGALFMVIIIIFVSFIAAILNPGVEFVFAYPILGGLMGAQFLSKKTTGLVFLLILVVTTIMHIQISGFDLVNIGVTSFYVLVVSVIVMLELTVQENDLEQIKSQAMVLVDRETNLNEVMQSTNDINQILKDRVKELDLRTAEITHLSRMGQMLQSCQNEEEARAVIKQLIPELFTGTRGAVYLINASRNYVEAVVEWGDRWENQKDRIFSLSDCWALRRGQLHLMQEGVTEVPCPHVLASKTSEFPNLCVPLLAQSEAQGILYLNSGVITEKLSEAIILLAQAASETLSLAFANMRLRESLKRQSIRDPLTGLFNRRYFDETFEREILRAARNHSSVGVIVMDVDHFKYFNDEYGHQAGDAVLFEFGKAFSTNTRASDFACRLGGEEFVLILPDTNLEATETLANNLREIIASLRVLYHGTMLPQVTISMGVTAYPDHGNEIDTLMRKADSALYQAKQAGRNRVIAALVGE